MRDLKQYAWPLGAFLLGVSLEMSGYTNVPFSIFLGIAAVLLLAIPAWEPARRWWQDYRAGRLRFPLRLSAIAVAGAAGLLTIIWLSPRAPNLTSLGYAILFLAIILTLIAFWMFIANVLVPMAQGTSHGKPRGSGSEQPKSQRDVSFKDAVYRVAFGEWPASEPSFDQEGEITKASEALKTMRQRAFDGELEVWGKPFRSSMTLGGEVSEGVWDLVPKEHWRTHRVWPLELQLDWAQVYTSKDLSGHDHESWCALKVSRAQVEQLWPIASQASRTLSSASPGIAESRRPITELREWAIQAGWNGDIRSVTCEGSDLWTFLRRLEQAAVDEKIMFWGRKYPYDIPEDIREGQKLVEIPPSHFEDHSLDVIEFAQNPNYDIFTGKLGVQRGYLRNQIYRDLHVDEQQAQDWLKTDGVPDAVPVIRLGLAPKLSPIGDFEPLCSIAVENVSQLGLSECLVDLEQLSGFQPPEMPLPLVLRTESQIRGNRSGPFKLRPGSPGQRKTIPIIFRDPKRKNEWYIFDENRNKYFIPMRDLEILVAIHCEKGTDRVLISLYRGEGYEVLRNLKIVAADFRLKE